MVRNKLRTYIVVCCGIIAVSACGADIKDVSGTNAAYPTLTAQAVINLDALNGRNGFTLEGVSPNDLAGYGLGVLEDFNNDGYDDFAIGSFKADIEGVSNAGQAYVVFGSTGGFPPLLSLDALDGTNGFAINFTGDNLFADDRVGASIHSAGDMNGDGISDLAVTRYQGDTSGPQAGEAYIIFGTSEDMPAVFDLGTIDGTNGFSIVGADDEDRLGMAVRSAGDFNADGIDDLAIGAQKADENGNRSGAGYVIFGRALGYGKTPIDLDDLDGSNGFEVNGAAEGDEMGGWVGRANDFNNDGFDDVLFSSRYANSNGEKSGSVYIIFGTDANNGASIELSNLDGTNGTHIIGAMPGDEAGIGVEEAGDFNGDGIADLIIGAHNADVSGRKDAGAVYVVFGRNSWPSTLPLSDFTASDGVQFHGANGGDRAGKGVHAAGDVDADGFDDVIFSSVSADPNEVINAGTTYVVYGNSTLDPVIDLRTLSETHGFLMNGIENSDRSGRMVSGNVDINNDGHSDVFMGAYLASSSGKTDAGAVYVVYGQLVEGSNQQNLSADGDGLFTSGRYVVQDSDAVTISVPRVNLSGLSGAHDQFDLEALFNMLSVSQTRFSGSSTAKSLDWTFDSGSETFSQLAAGETLTLDYTIRATDSGVPSLVTNDYITISIVGQ